MPRSSGEVVYMNMDELDAVEDDDDDTAEEDAVEVDGDGKFNIILIAVK